MKLLDYTIYLPNYSTPFRIIPVGCLHADDEGHRRKLWERCRKDIEQPHSYMIGAGDYRDLLRTTARNYLKQYVSDKISLKNLDDVVRESTIDFYHEYFKGLENKIIGLGKGNHLYEYSSGSYENDNHQLACLLNCAYLDNPSFIRLTVRDKSQGNRCLGILKILLHHGNWSGGSSRPGGSVNAAEMKALGFDFDIYIFSHDHRKWAMHIPAITIPKTGELQVIERPRCFIRTGCFVAGYDQKCGPGNYVQDKLMHPSDLGYVTLTVNFAREYDAERYQRRGHMKPKERRGGAVSNMKHRFSVTF
jgi:hypothetical protein